MLACLRHSPHGLGWILVIVWNTWFTDSFALLGGRAFGHHLLAPKLSPNKTYEGALIGVLAGTLVGGMMTVFVFGVSVPLAFGLNLMISALTIVGDLIESAVKRGFGVKDAGHLLPGHGGVLDRIDGFLVSTPFFVLALMAFGLL
jgi:phosphatidate cytidylyltransferase